MISNLASSLGAGTLPGRPTPTPSKQGRRNVVNAWPRVCAALETADRPMYLHEIMDATGLKRANVVNALTYDADVIERTGRAMHYKFALRRSA